VTEASAVALFRPLGSQAELAREVRLAARGRKRAGASTLSGRRLNRRDKRQRPSERTEEQAHRLVDVSSGKDAHCRRPIE
jgi:hypothetical protein